MFNKVEEIVLKIEKENNKYEINDILFKSPNYEYKKNTNFNRLEFNNNWIYAKDLSIIYLPQLTELIYGIIKIINKKCPFNSFNDVVFPRIVKRDTLEKYGIISDWPDYLICLSKHSNSMYHQPIKNIGDYYLDPVQCAPFYEYIASDRIKNYPIMFREILGGWSYRNEKESKINNIDKNVMFIRYEFVFAGNEREVKTIRNELLKGLSRILCMMRIRHRIVVGEGCYDSPTDILKKKLSCARNKSDIPVIDILAYNPENETWQEVAGGSYFGDEKVSKYIMNDEGIESCCLGIGISRLAYTILNNYGLKKKYWPKIIRKSI